MLTLVISSGIRTQKEMTLTLFSQTPGSTPGSSHRRARAHSSSVTLPRRMAAPFVPLATQRPVRLITLGIGKSNRTLVPIGKDYQVRCLLRYDPLRTHRLTPKPCVTTQAIVPYWDSDSDEDEEDEEEDEEDEDGVRALGSSASYRSLSAPAHGSTQQRSARPGGAHRAPAASCRSAAAASRVITRVDAHKARRALGRKSPMPGDDRPVEHSHLALQLAASTAAKLTAGACSPDRPLCPSRLCPLHPTSLDPCARRCLPVRRGYSCGRRSRA